MATCTVFIGFDESITRTVALWGLVTSFVSVTCTRDSNGAGPLMLRPVIGESANSTT